MKFLGRCRAAISTVLSLDAGGRAKAGVTEREWCGLQDRHESVRFTRIPAPVTGP